MNVKHVSIVVIVVVIIAIAFYLLSPLFIVKHANETMPEGKIIAEGVLQAGAHDVKGKVLIIEQDGKRYLRFEDLDTVNGPDLRIYLSSDKSASDYVDLGAIRATKGSVNYELPPGVELSKYNKVLIWCRAFRVLFSFAALPS